MKMPDKIGAISTRQHINILLNSYQQCFAEKLIENDNNALQAIWEADFVLLSHGIQQDPIFNFANPSAMALFELDFHSFIQLPSKYSAEPVSQTEREQLLAQVTKHGCIKNYTGIRVSSSGKRFYIENAKVWNLYDDAGDYYGQAATFRNWRYL